MSSGYLNSLESLDWDDLQMDWVPRRLLFSKPAGTSRGVLTDRPVWYLRARCKSSPEIIGIGEVASLTGLSLEAEADMPAELDRLCQDRPWVRNHSITAASDMSSVRFGFETACLDLAGGGQRVLFDTPFSRGESAIPINGLIWMSDVETMLAAINQKVSAGFRCIKLKIGAISFEEELSLLSHIRSTFSRESVEIRLDANGAFDVATVDARLDALTAFDIHSIEQPIAVGQHEALAELCERSPIPVALDEELIGIDDMEGRSLLLQTVQPAYIILKPSLHGGIAGCTEWIDCARLHGVGWWATSALESNIGLNAIAQWVSDVGVDRPQGLGTGGLFVKNVPSPLRQVNDGLVYDATGTWELGGVLDDS